MPKVPESLESLINFEIHCIMVGRGLLDTVLFFLGAGKTGMVQVEGKYNGRSHLCMKLLFQT